MRVYGLIGYPLGHSFSKQYFTEKFAREGLVDCLFEAFPISSIDQFKSLLVANPLLKGIAVTIPYKEQVLKFADELSDEVIAIGATNSIKVNEDKLTAYNTDIIGFEQTFTTHLQPAHTNALVLGTGGASKAVQYVLKKLGMHYKLVTRNVGTSDDLITYKDVDEHTLEKYSVIINCTPVGMFPNNDEAPELPYDAITPAHYLYDLVYKPSKTLFLQRGEAAGATIQNGYDMLLMQAEASWKIWNDL